MLRQCRGGGGDDVTNDMADEMQKRNKTKMENGLKSIIEHIQSTSNNNNNNNNNGMSKRIMDSIQDLNHAVGISETGEKANKFLHGLATSDTFVQMYWHKRPLLIRGKHTGGWVNGLFTVEKDLKLIDGSYINGYQTAEVLRNGTETDTWKFRMIKEELTRTTTWTEVEKALEGGTIYFNTAGSLWPVLGALCRLTNNLFGIPSNVNVYVTPPGVQTSVPPHTDRQDVLVFQTAGAKRWRVYAPPPRSKETGDPLNRGKGGNVLSFDELNEPLIDAVLRPGDVLYVPTGFPHTTDTCTVIPDHDDDNDADHLSSTHNDQAVSKDTSVHLTLGLDTHVWALTYAHMRWCLLQRAGKSFEIRLEDDDAFWDTIETIPLGFLGTKATEEGPTGDGHDSALIEFVTKQLKERMIRLEPNRWRIESDNVTKDVDDTTTKGEDLPTEEQFREVVEYFFKKHIVELLDLHEEMFSNIDPKNEDTIIKAFQCSQKQSAIMEQFGIFSKNDAMRESFAARRLNRDKMANQASS